MWGIPLIRRIQIVDTRTRARRATSSLREQRWDRSQMSTNIDSSRPPGQRLGRAQQLKTHTSRLHNPSLSHGVCTLFVLARVAATLLVSCTGRSGRPHQSRSAAKALKRIAERDIDGASRNQASTRCLGDRIIIPQVGTKTRPRHQHQ